MGQPPTMCTSVTHLAISALRSARTTSWFTARAGPTRPTLEAIGSAVRAPMDSAQALPIIGEWALVSVSAKGSGSEPGSIPGGGRMDGAGATVMDAIMLASITLISKIIGIT